MYYKSGHIMSIEGIKMVQNKNPTEIIYNHGDDSTHCMCKTFLEVKMFM